MSDDYVRILPDISDDITHWVCRGLKCDEDWLGEHLTFGFAINNRMIGGLIFHTLRHNLDVWWTIYTEDKRWCNRHVLRRMFAAAFDDFGCRRINILVEQNNLKSLRQNLNLKESVYGLKEYRQVRLLSPFC